MARDTKGRFVKGTSGNPRGRAGASREDSSPRGDGWRSILTGLGYDAHDKSRSYSYLAEIVNPDAAIEVWRGDDLAARIIETPPNEMLRAGFELSIQEEDGGPDPLKSKIELAGENGKAQREISGTLEVSPDQLEQEGGPPRKDQAEDAEADGGGDSEVDDSMKALQETITTRWEELGLVDALWNAVAFERAYGGAAILLGVNDGSGDLSKPLDLERVRSLDWLTTLEPRELTPQTYYVDPFKPKYGKPETFTLNPYAAGSGNPAELNARGVSSHQVHESRVIVFPGIRVTRRNMSGLNGWGDSILTRVHSVLRDFNVGYTSAAILLNDFAQAVFKMKGLAELVAMDNKTGDQTVASRMAAVELSRSTARAVLIDAEEEFERKQTPLSGLPELLDRFATRLAAAADMPLTLLMGQSPGGLNATGESDIRFFYDRIAAQQERKIKPAIERITQLLLRVEGEEPENWSVSFHPLWQPTEAEQATARKTQAETDAIYISNEVLHPEEVAMSRFGGDEFSFDTTVDFEARAELDKIEAEQKAADDEAKAEQLQAMQEGAAPVPPGQEGAAPVPPAPEAPVKEQVKKAFGK